MHDGAVVAVAFSPHGDKVLTGSDDGTTQLWDAETGEPRGEPMKHKGAVNAVAFGPDGKTVLTGSLDGTARLWDAETGEPWGEPMNHEDLVYAVAFSADAKTVLTGSRDRTARLWHVTLPTLDEPGRLKLSVEVRTGLFFDGQGNLQRLTQEQWLEQSKRLKRLGGPCDIVR